MLSEVVNGDGKSVIELILENYLLELGVLEDAYITSQYLMRDFTEREARRLA